MHIGIIGRPSCGKTTVFRALTSADLQASRGHKSDVRVVEVPDPRLLTLANMYNPRKVTPAVMSFVDPVLTGQTGAFTLPKAFWP